MFTYRGGELKLLFESFSWALSPKFLLDGELIPKWRTASAFPNSASEISIAQFEIKLGAAFLCNLTVNI